MQQRLHALSISEKTYFRNEISAHQGFTAARTSKYKSQMRTRESLQTKQTCRTLRDGMAQNDNKTIPMISANHQVGISNKFTVKRKGRFRTRWPQTTEFHRRVTTTYQLGIAKTFQENPQGSLQDIMAQHGQMTTLGFSGKRKVRVSSEFQVHP